ncbi:MAG: acyl-CoA dehydratase activase-related protein [Succinivibrionaceae bacterium]
MNQQSATANAGIFIGLDIGSTTVKAVAINQEDQIIFSRYRRHFSRVREISADLIAELIKEIKPVRAAVGLTGSGALSLAKDTGIPFFQEVIACNKVISLRYPDANAVVELGGEDAKLTFLGSNIDQRMNETCAGGTGAFIDQMAAFLRTDAIGLNDLALKHKVIYPIASRCGVFAKTDIMPLINDGCAREDIAASIFQAVVNQTISGLARDRTIEGKVVFLGGPLFFLSALRERFTATLKKLSDPVFPDDGQYFVALGAAILLRNSDPRIINLHELISSLRQKSNDDGISRLPPLFTEPSQYLDFVARHQTSSVRRRLLATASGNAWLGIDSGSTTIKACLINDSGEILYESYGPNRGNPLQAAISILQEILETKPDNLTIAGATATGYGSALLTAALHLDHDEVETVAHFTAARFFDPQVSFIIDIGGQDIKCLYIKNGAIQRIQLNEACSAGCGSFIENFAQSLNIPLSEFIQKALFAKAPVDLGTRCTVFMNSKVKEAQKEGADVADIAAGLSYSVIRNACYKVMKLTSLDILGTHVVAQGGAFFNDTLLRVLETQLGIPVTRPEIAGLMGAFGSALIARDRATEKGKSGILNLEELNAFTIKTTSTRCGRCSNACMLTISRFADHKRFITGNRCEKGGDHRQPSALNLFSFRMKRLFDDYQPLNEEDAPRGTVGIPRALNIFEDYPLWFTILTNLGFRVVLSDPSSKDMYYEGYDSIPSQTVCYPAKLAHGHVVSLIKKGIKTIFMPCISHEKLEEGSSAGDFNCPVVAGYPELLARNISLIQEFGVNFVYDFLPLDREYLPQRLRKLKLFKNIPFQEIERAVSAGFAELESFRADIRQAGEQALKDLQATGHLGIILAGHPYHIDPEVHHGIADLIASTGTCVLTADSISHLTDDPEKLRIVNQWAYHSRLFRAGEITSRFKNNLAVLQLVSFGCGLDAITSDQLEEIQDINGRLYAQIKIDEGMNLGPAKIRIRSLIASMQERIRKQTSVPSAERLEIPLFTEDMKKTHTLIVPQMSPIHFQFIETVFQAEGYKIKFLPELTQNAVELGIRYVNNDACFPAIAVIGQLLEALKSSDLDLEHVALLITQTGGGCRATNYVGFLRKALRDSGLNHIPVIPISTNVDPYSPGFKLSKSMVKRIMMGMQYADMLMRMINRMEPYEKIKGTTKTLTDKWANRIKANLQSGSILKFQYNVWRMIRDFDRIELATEERRPRVGIVGEILLKYHNDANHNVAKLIEEEGCEVVSTDMLGFFLYCMYDHIFNYKHLNGSRKNYRIARFAIKFVEFTTLAQRFFLKHSKHFTAPAKLKKLRKGVKGLVSLGHQSGEGWMLVAEMVHMLEHGTNNILCIQPFGCLPNHITGKGMIKTLRQKYPDANIIALDYDPGTSETNQINRIKLMLNSAK